MCPLFRVTHTEAATPRAKANLLRVLVDPTAVTHEEVKTVAGLCVNCKMCRDECDARVGSGAQQLHLPPVVNRVPEPAVKLG